jgi:hypothetical protein
MSKVEDSLRPEYTRAVLGKGVRGKYYDAYQEGTVVTVQLEPDVAKVFPDAEAVNQALRTLIRLMAAGVVDGQSPKAAG